MISLDKVLHTEIPSETPTIMERFLGCEIYIEYKDGTVGTYLNERHHRTHHNYNNHIEFLDATGMNEKEFNLMYYENPKVNTLLKARFPKENIKKVLVADL